MIYREKTLKEIKFVSGDICKECILIDCIDLSLAHLEKCEIIETQIEAPVKKKKTKKCIPCEAKIEVVDDANG